MCCVVLAFERVLFLLFFVYLFIEKCNRPIKREVIAQNVTFLEKARDFVCLHLFVLSEDLINSRD